LALDKKGAEEAGARLAFIDEVGFSKTPPVAKTWSPKGVTPIIRHSFDREKLNAIASIDCLPDGTDPGVMFYMQPDSVVSGTIIDYLDALHREIPGKIVLLWDGYSSHKSKVVKEHIAKCVDWLTVEKFPAYAPELNPPEYLFSALKHKDLGNLPAISVDHIAHKIESAVDRLAGDQIIIQGFLRASGLFDIPESTSE
jgi:transposase